MNDKVVDFAEAKDRLAPERKEKAAKALRKQFQQAMGWRDAISPKKAKGSKGPKSKRSSKRSSKPTGNGPGKGKKR